MQVTVRLFAVIREEAGVSKLTLNLNDDATVADARDALLRQFPKIERFISKVAYAVNHSYAPLEAVLNDGDELALLPPVSGG